MHGLFDFEPQRYSYFIFSHFFFDARLKKKGKLSMSLMPASKKAAVGPAKNEIFF